MNQICTNKKQSSRLLEAGIRPETADMYLDEFELPVAFEYGRVEKHVGQDMAFSAWSLSKMIEMLPTNINGYILSVDFENKGMEYSMTNFCDRLDYLYIKGYENLFDGIIDCIEWLIKEGHLDNKYLTDKCGDCRLIEDEDANGDAWCSFHQKPVRCDSKACKDILEKGGSNA
ncbi:hypothetical protein ACTQXG_20570 [Parabacteroides distasonis]|uniref:hypothetical protein n=1 Tax=Parabacteroides distasonis TaxID=823 RepID=UPI003F9751E4